MCYCGGGVIIHILKQFTVDQCIFSAPDVFQWLNEIN